MPGACGIPTAGNLVNQAIESSRQHARKTSHGLLEIRFTSKAAYWQNSKAMTKLYRVHSHTTYRKQKKKRALQFAMARIYTVKSRSVISSVHQKSTSELHLSKYPNLTAIFRMRLNFIHVANSSRGFPKFSRMSITYRPLCEQKLFGYRYTLLTCGLNLKWIEPLLVAPLRLRHEFKMADAVTLTRMHPST